MSAKKERRATSSEHRRLRRQRWILSIIGLLVIAAFVLSSMAP
jgi:hypothetical protein